MSVNPTLYLPFAEGDDTMTGFAERNVAWDFILSSYSICGTNSFSWLCFWGQRDVSAYMSLGFFYSSGNESSFTLSLFYVTGSYSSFSFKKSLFKPLLLLKFYEQLDENTTWL